MVDRACLSRGGGLVFPPSLPPYLFDERWVEPLERFGLLLLALDVVAHARDVADRGGGDEHRKDHEADREDARRVLRRRRRRRDP